MKTSVIVLWIIAALFLVCSPQFLPDQIAEFFASLAIAGVLGVIGFSQHRKGKGASPSKSAPPPPQPVTSSPISAPPPSRAAATSSKSAPPPPPADEIPYEFLRTKIAGVTFKDGRKSRQTILRRLYWKDEPFDKNAAEVTLERGEYEGKPSFAVLLNGSMAGYVPAEHAPYVAENYDRCDGITHIEAYKGRENIYGAQITIRFRKP